MDARQIHWFAFTLRSVEHVFVHGWAWGGGAWYESEGRRMDYENLEARKEKGVGGGMGWGGVVAVVLV